MGSSTSGRAHHNLIAPRGACTAAAAGTSCGDEGAYSQCYPGVAHMWPELALIFLPCTPVCYVSSFQAGEANRGAQVQL